MRSEYAANLALAQTINPEHAWRARQIARTLGTFIAARYLALRNVPIEAAINLLARRKSC